MAGVIPKDRLAAYRRWQINSFDEDLQAPESQSAQTISAEESGAETDAGIPAEMGLPTAEELEKIYEDARAEGYRQGFEEGMAAGENNRHEVTMAEMARLTALTGNLQISLAHMDQTIADQLLDLALEIATQVLRSRIEVKRDILAPVIREAIAALPIHHTKLVVHLNPDDAAMVKEELGEQFAQSGTHIIEDTEISPGGCSLRTGNSEIDATIETRWKRVLEALGVTPTEWLKTP